MRVVDYWLGHPFQTLEQLRVSEFGTLLCEREHGEVWLGLEHLGSKVAQYFFHSLFMLTAFQRISMVLSQIQANQLLFLLLPLFLPHLRCSKASLFDYEAQSSHICLIKLPLLLDKILHILRQFRSVRDHISNFLKGLIDQIFYQPIPFLRDFFHLVFLHFDFPNIESH